MKVGKNMLIKKYDFSTTKLNNMNETAVQNSMLEVLANNYILISNNEEFNENAYAYFCATFSCRLCKERYCKR